MTQVTLSPWGQRRSCQPRPPCPPSLPPPQHPAHRVRVLQGLRHLHEAGHQVATAGTPQQPLEGAHPPRVDDTGHEAVGTQRGHWDGHSSATTPAPFPTRTLQRCPCPVACLQPLSYSLVQCPLAPLQPLSYGFSRCPMAKPYLQP